MHEEGEGYMSPMSQCPLMCGKIFTQRRFWSIPSPLTLAPASLPLLRVSERYLGSPSVSTQRLQFTLGPICGVWPYWGLDESTVIQMTPSLW